MYLFYACGIIISYVIKKFSHSRKKFTWKKNIYSKISVEGIQPKITKTYFIELTISFEYMCYYVLILTADTRQAGGQADGTMLLANSTPLFPSQAGFWKYTFGFCYLAVISNFLPYLATV